LYKNYVNIEALLVYIDYFLLTVTVLAELFDVYVYLNRHFRLVLIWEYGTVLCCKMCIVKC